MRTHSTAHLIQRFKTCENCNTWWGSLEAFIEDPSIALVGYMPTFDDAGSGLFLFNHDCGTTLACQVSTFGHLHDGPIYRENKHGSQACPGHCLNKTDFSPCPARCCCAFARDILEVIKTWPKASDQSDRPM